MLSVVGFGHCPAVIVDSSNVPEMTEVRFTEQGVVFGASVTLSTMEEFLQDTIEHLPGRFTYWTVQTRSVTLIIVGSHW